MLVSDRVSFEKSLRIPVRLEKGECGIFEGAAINGTGEVPLYFKYQGTGKVDFLEFELTKNNRRKRI